MRMIAVSGVLLVLLGGCSRVPKPTSYEYSYQPHMQAAHHWNELAREVANQIASRVLDESPLLPPLAPPPPPQGAVPAPPQNAVQTTSDFGTKIPAPPRFYPVFIQGTAQSPFDVAFRTFLVSALTQRGVPVARMDNAPFKVDWDVMPLVHNAQRSTSFPGGWIPRAALSAGVGSIFNVEPAFDTSVPHREIIITTRLTDAKNSLVQQRSDIFYINDADPQHYGAQRPVAQKTFGVVGN